MLLKIGTLSDYTLNVDVFSLFATLYPEICKTV